jgi:succinate-semialdehyde dehydrogenase/glutarate-semialdehyde dehydrogenase
LGNCGSAAGVAPPAEIPAAAKVAAAAAKVTAASAKVTATAAEITTTPEVSAAGIAAAEVTAASVTAAEIAAGAAVAEVAGRALKKVVLELGGSDPFILLSTNDLDAVVERAVAARMDNTGQSCNAAKRFIVAADLYDEFVDKFTAAVLAHADGIAPLSSVAAAERLQDQIDRAVEERNKSPGLAGPAHSSSGGIAGGTSGGVDTVPHDVQWSAQASTRNAEMARQLGTPYGSDQYGMYRARPGSAGGNQ